MKRVTIYLRSFEQNGEKHLAMFDSNRNGAIDTLITDVQAGATIIWKLDRFSGIRTITKIYSKEGGKHNIFKNDPKKRLLCKGFKFQLSNDVEEGKEKYAIDYIHLDNTKVTIDPYIRVPPPPIRG
ncbi:MAG: hypothetical protein NTV31_04285 [Bacteroidia bacterium]|nr:hypothetical protein [Bacteroidia bacterium]